jgi:DNA-directed RNA polymerase specialized sigma24 family protein
VRRYRKKDIGHSELSFAEWLVRKQFRKYTPRLKEVSGMDDDDLVQEIFLKLLRHPPRSEMAMTTALGKACKFMLGAQYTRFRASKRFCKGHRVLRNSMPEPFYEEPDNLELAEQVEILWKILQSVRPDRRDNFCKRRELFGATYETLEATADRQGVTKQAIQQRDAVVVEKIKTNWDLYERKLRND